MAHGGKDHAHLGARVGVRLAHLMAAGATHHLRQSMNTRADIHAQGINKFWDIVSAETRTHFSPFLAEAAAAIPDDHPLKPALRFMAHGKGEAQAMASVMTTAMATSTAIGAGIADLLAPLNQDIMAAFPFTALDPRFAAELASRGIADEQWANDEAHKNGVNQARYKMLREAAREHPELGELWQLLNRGLISDSYAAHVMRRHGLDDDTAMRLLELRHVLLSPADAALAVLRGNMTHAEGVAAAHRQGVDGVDFEVLIGNTGEPPAEEMMLEAYRRGFIDKARLERGIRQSRIRNEWLDVVERLRYRPMSTADAIEAVVRNYIPESQGKAIADQNGLEPSHWHPLLLAHGRPPGHMQMVQLQRRGLVTQAEVDQAVRESDIKTSYVATLRGLKDHIPAERQVISLVSHGAISNEEAIRLLRDDGYAPDLARAMVKSGTSQRHTAAKHLSLTVILELYRDHAIDSGRAKQLIEALGYPPVDIPLMLRLEELRRERHLREQAAGATRAGFLAHHIDEGEVQAELAEEGFRSEEVAHLLHLWKIERRAHRHDLTPAQLLKANTMGLLDDLTCEQRLMRAGYTIDDARLLMNSEKGRSVPAP